MAGVILWFFNIQQRSELSVRDGFLVVALFWILLGVVGSLPFLLGLHLGVTDAIFESVSGFTTTGARLLIRTGLFDDSNQSSHVPYPGILTPCSSKLPSLAPVWHASQRLKLPTSGLSSTTRAGISWCWRRK